MYEPPLTLQGLAPTLDAPGVDLLENMLRFDPAKRITASEAMKHPYFDDLNPVIKEVGIQK